MFLVVTFMAKIQNCRKYLPGCRLSFFILLFDTIYYLCNNSMNGHLPIVIESRHIGNQFESPLICLWEEVEIRARIPPIISLQTMGSFYFILGLAVFG